MNKFLFLPLFLIASSLFAQNKKIDSVTFQYHFDDWKEPYITYRYEYDEDGRLEFAYTVDYEENETNRYVYTYNESGRLTKVERQDRYRPNEMGANYWRNTSWEYTYDANGNKTATSILVPKENGDSDEWVNDSREEIKYDNKNKPVERLLLYWNPDNGAWEKQMGSLLVKTFVISDQLSTDTVWMYNSLNQSFDYLGLSENNYSDGLLQESIMKKYNKDNFYNSLKTSYTYDRSGNCIKKTDYGCDLTSKKWKEYGITEYTYDSNSENTQTILSQIPDIELAEFDNKNIPATTIYSDYYSDTDSYAYVQKLVFNYSESNTTDPNGGTTSVQHRDAYLSAHQTNKNTLVINGLQEIAQFKITDVLGHQLQIKVQPSVTSEVDITGFSNGIYFYSLSSGNKLITGKFIK